MAPVPFAKRLEPPLLRTKVDAQQTLWEAILPPELLRLPPGLEQVDHLLDDPVFFEPFVPFFHPKIGRPSIPMETYLRMMFLRFRYRLGFETLCAEVTDSLAWRRFCRIRHQRRRAASHHSHEDHHPLRRAGGGPTERSAASKGHGGGTW